MAGKIFISYRRDDSRYQARMIYEAFLRGIPRENVFMDIDTIPLGVNFVKVLEGWVEQCEVLLVLMGAGWVNSTDPKTGKRRLDNPKDFVRVEIRGALTRDIPVVPVILDGAELPDEAQLPDDIKGLLSRNAEFVEYRNFDADVQRLIKKLGIGDVPKRAVAPAIAAKTLRDQVTDEPIIQRSAEGFEIKADAADKIQEKKPLAKEPTKRWLTPVVVGIVLLGAIVASVYVFVISQAMKYESGAGTLEQIKQIEAAASKSDEAEKARQAAVARVDEADKARQAAEAKAVEAEKARLAAEAKAADAEKVRQAAAARIDDADKAKQAALAKADIAERSRQAAEARATDSERARQVAEAKAADSEKARQAAEAKAAQVTALSAQTLIRDEITIQVRSPFLGVTASNLSPALAEGFGLDPATQGVAIINVAPGSIAESLGFRRGDVVLVVNNNTIARTRDLDSASRELPKEWHITVSRQGQRLSVVFGERATETKAGK
jgi:type II secretory pathway component PulC